MTAGLPVYPEDAVENARMRKRLRRNGAVLIVILDLLVIAVGVSGAGDLRRMATPAGAAAAWADAASSGDCDRYLDLETPGREAADLAGVRLPTGATSRHDELCREVVAAWSAYGTQNSRVTASTRGFDTVRLTVESPTRTVTGELLMSHAGGRWRVASPPAPCATPSYSPQGSLCASFDLAGGVTG